MFHFYEAKQWSSKTVVNLKDELSVICLVIMNYFPHRLGLTLNHPIQEKQKDNLGAMKGLMNRVINMCSLSPGWTHWMNDCVQSGRLVVLCVPEELIGRKKWQLDWSWQQCAERNGGFGFIQWTLCEKLSQLRSSEAAVPCGKGQMETEEDQCELRIHREPVESQVSKSSDAKADKKWQFFFYLKCSFPYSRWLLLKFCNEVLSMKADLWSSRPIPWSWKVLCELIQSILKQKEFQKENIFERNATMLLQVYMFGHSYTVFCKCFSNIVRECSSCFLTDGIIVN